MTAVTLPGVGEIEYEVAWITSEDASRMLEFHRDDPNRRISTDKVLQYQADMENGRWHFEGAPIRLSKTNRLLDGQHRLTALANAIPDQRLPFTILRGLDDDAQLYMDQVYTRTVGQQLSLKGVANSSLKAAAAKLYLEWTRGRLFRSMTHGATSKPEITEWVLHNQELMDQL